MRGDYPELRIRRQDRIDPLWRGDKVDENDSVFLHASVDQNLDSRNGGAACRQHRIQKEDVALGNVWRKLIVK